MYIGTIKSQTAFVRYSLLRIEVDQKSHWQETAAVEPANSSHASIYCFVVTTRVCSYFWKSSDLMPICHLYLADILNHVSSTSCLHHWLHHKVSCEPIWALFRDLCHLLICVVWWGFHGGSAHDNKPGRITISYHRIIAQTHESTRTQEPHHHLQPQIPGFAKLVSGCWQANECQRLDRPMDADGFLWNHMDL